jgi:hypothetical protein
MEACAEDKDLLMNSITKSVGTIRILAHDVSNSGVRDNITSAIENIAFEVSDEVSWYLYKLNNKSAE